MNDAPPPLAPARETSRRHGLDRVQPVGARQVVQSLDDVAWLPVAVVIEHGLEHIPGQGDGPIALDDAQFGRAKSAAPLARRPWDGVCPPSLPTEMPPRRGLLRPGCDGFGPLGRAACLSTTSTATPTASCTRRRPPPGIVNQGSAPSINGDPARECVTGQKHPERNDRASVELEEP